MESKDPLPDVRASLGEASGAQAAMGQRALLPTHLWVSLGAAAGVVTASRALPPAWHWLTTVLTLGAVALMITVVLRMRQARAAAGVRLRPWGGPLWFALVFWVAVAATANLLWPEPTAPGWHLAYALRGAGLALAYTLGTLAADRARVRFATRHPA